MYSNTVTEKKMQFKWEKTRQTRNKLLRSGHEENYIIFVGFGVR